jgi:hypothetical protein
MKLDLEKQMEVWGKKSCLVQHDFGPVWSWDRIIRNYDNTLFFHNEITRQGFPDTKIIDDLGNGGFAIHGSSINPDVRQVLEMIQTIDSSLEAKASLYISFNRQARTFPEHRDPLHVWIHQFQGETDWYVEDGEYLLKPGDILYIPPMFEHCARIIEPRCSMSWNLGPNGVQAENIFREQYFNK